jgi:hypothetical protein
MPYADPQNPDYTEMYTYADLDALVELHGHIRAVNPITTVNIRLAHALQPDDLLTHLVLLGGVDWNVATRDLLARLHLPVRQISRLEEDAYFEVAHGERPDRFRPVFVDSDTGSVLFEDVAHFFRGRNPFNIRCTLSICNGMYSRGTLGAVRALTDFVFRGRNEEYVRTRFGSHDTFSILMRVPIVNGSAVTPDWTLPETRLHEWPEDVE